MKKYLVRLGFIIGASLLPLFSVEAVGEAVNNLNQIFNTIQTIVQAVLIPTVFALAILAFFWGVFRYVFSQSTDDKLAGKGIMLWSLVAIFVMVSVYGIIRLAQNTLGVSNDPGSLRAPNVF